MRKVYLYSMVLVLLAGCTSPEGLLDCCSGGSAGADTGLVCENCAMMITDEMLKFSGYAKPASGDEASFCSICCMLTYAEREGDDVDLYVLDYNTLEWMDAEYAYYLKGDVKAPMGCKLIAFENHESALEYKEDHNGEILGFNDIS